MSKQRRKLSPTFKAKVVLEAVKGEETAAQLAAGYQVHPSPIQVWKKVLTAGAPGLSLTVGKDQSYPAQPGVGRRHHLLAHGPGIPLLDGQNGLGTAGRW